MPYKARNAALASSKRRKSLKYKDKDRYHCPYPGCVRSCAELWRLKVHYRAPSNIRGSGVERGHGTELEFCPKCKEKLEVGKNHGQCRAAPTSVRPADMHLATAKVDKSRARGSRITETSSGEDGDGVELLHPEIHIARTPTTGQVDSDGFDSLPACDDNQLSSLVSRSSLESGHLISTPDERDMSVFSSPTCLVDGGATARLDSLKTEALQLDLLGSSKAPSSMLEGTIFDCDIDEEVVLPRAFIPELERQAPQLFPYLHSDLLRTSPHSRLRPASELLDLASYEANIMKVLSTRSGAVQFAG